MSDRADELLRAENERLRGAILWALGYYDFPERKSGQGAYWWRIELAQRAALEPPETVSPIQQTAQPTEKYMIDLLAARDKAKLEWIRDLRAYASGSGGTRIDSGECVELADLLGPVNTPTQQTAQPERCEHGVRWEHPCRVCDQQTAQPVAWLVTDGKYWECERYEATAILNASRITNSQVIPLYAAPSVQPIPREPTDEMLRVNVENGAASRGGRPVLCSGCLLGEVWQAMHDAATKTK